MLEFTKKYISFVIMEEIMENKRGVMMSFVEVKDVYKRYYMGDNVIVANNGVSFYIE
jgi:putative ABC transport system ATP-binding protein